MQYDVLIVGGGITGCIAALALARQTELSIAVLETSHITPTWSPEEYNYRVSALSLASQRILQNLDIWKPIKNLRVSPYKTMKVWSEQLETKKLLGEINFSAQEMGFPQLGWIVENNLLLHCLREAIKKYAQIHFVSGVDLKYYHEQDSLCLLETNENKIFCSKLVIGADGKHSWIREQLQIKTTDFAYHQKAIVTEVTTEKNHAATALQVFLPTGPLAFLPLSNSYKSSIVWTLPETLAKHYMDLSDAEFIQLLQTAIGNHLGNIQKIEQRYNFALSYHHAQQYCKSNVVLVGDAAHSVHPLAGLGLNLGMFDVACLMDLIDPIQGTLNFRKYERWRKADNGLTLKGIDVIHHFFANEQIRLQSLGSFGLNALNRMPFFKKYLAKIAFGERMVMPRLAC